MIYTIEKMAQAIANIENANGNDENQIRKNDLFVRLEWTSEAGDIIRLRKGLESALVMLMASGYGDYEDETRAISIVLQSLEFDETQVKL